MCAALHRCCRAQDLLHHILSMGETHILCLANKVLQHLEIVSLLVCDFPMPCAENLKLC